MRCSFCTRRPAAAVSEGGRVGCCGDCAADGGPAARMIGEATGHGRLEPTVAPGDGKMDRLIRDAKGPAKLSRTDALGRAGNPATSLQSAAAKVRARARGRSLTRAELSLSLEATKEANRTSGRTGRGNRPALTTAKIVEAVRRAGLKT